MLDETHHNVEPSDDDNNDPTDEEEDVNSVDSQISKDNSENSDVLEERNNLMEFTDSMLSLLY